MDLSLFSPSFELSTSFFANVSLSLPLSLSILSRAFFLCSSFFRPRRDGSGSPPMSLPLLSFSSFSPLYSLLCILIASLSIRTSCFLLGVPSSLALCATLCRIFLPTSQSVDSFCHCLFPSMLEEAARSSFQLEGERAPPPLTRGRPSRSPRRFKLLMSIFRLVRLSELVHRRRCVLPIKVFNESGRKMAPARPR